MAEKIRSFLAIELPEQLKDSLDALRQLMDLPQYDVRWVSSKNMHLTLRFLGEITIEAVADVSLAAEKAAKKTRPFQINIRGMGAFPSLGAPRVIWAGTEHSDSLVRLEKNLRRKMEQNGWPSPDKPFHSHLTLGRVKSARGKGELKKHLQKNQGVTIGQMQVDHFSLIKSELRPHGPIYSILNLFHLENSI